MFTNKKIVLLTIVSMVSLLVLILLSLVWGATSIPLEKIMHVIIKDDESEARTIVWDLRLPRALMAMFIGANLAVAGALMQGLTKNPLAEPKIMGITAGAAVMVVIIEFLFVGLSYVWFSPLVFLGAAAGGSIVYGLSMRGDFSPVRLTLAGVAVSAFLHAMTVGVLVLLGEDAAAVYSWLAGSLNGLSWQHMGLVVPWTGIGLVVAFSLRTKLNLLELGDDVAKGLGVQVGIIKLVTAVIVVVLAGSSVSIAGAIGFIGLIVPHLARKMVGTDYKYLIPVSAFIGSFLLLAADLLARTIAQPIELPVGVFTALIGCPYFLYLVRKQGSSHG